MPQKLGGGFVSVFFPITCRGESILKAIFLFKENLTVPDQSQSDVNQCCQQY